jgi:class 3 adenylate cyclase
VGIPLGGAEARGPDPRSYTPPHLAEKILRQREDVEGERRTVTVLFIDAVDSTPLAERLGEEHLYSLMQGCLARMIEAVHCFEGHVKSFTGDGIMAVFGAPIAHEGSARRAVAAAVRAQRALEEERGRIRARLGVECRFRMGLNTGPVVVGRVSDELAMELTAVGDTVNLAARVQSLADPGAICLTDATCRAVADYFDCEPVGARRVKGKDEPIHVHRVLREKPHRSRFQVAAERGLAPFRRPGGGVGHPGSVPRAGPPGPWADRLRHRGGGPREDPPPLRVPAAGGRRRDLAGGHCVSTGRHTPYLPLIDVVQGAFGVEEADDEGAVIARQEQGSSGWDEAARSTVPYLRFLLSVDPGDRKVERMDPRERRAGLLDALRALLVQLTARGPLVVVLEDLHWADEPTDQALAALADVVAATPILLVLTARPGYEHAPERTYAARLPLVPLAEEESAVLVGGVLQAEPPAGLKRMVADKAEGNPFFVEEVVRSLLEAGVLARANGSYRLDRTAEEIHIPGTIQEVVLARIDRLDRPAKGTLQLASVIGREFTLRLLERISDPQARLEGALGELKALELIYEKGVLPRARLHVQTRRHPRRRVLDASGPTAHNPPPHGGDGDRGAVRRAPGRASSTRRWPITTTRARRGRRPSSTSSRPGTRRPPQGPTKRPSAITSGRARFANGSGRPPCRPSRPPPAGGGS